MLGIEELDDLLDKISKKVIYANRTGTLNDLLIKLDLTEFCENRSAYETDKNGKIVVIGQSEIDKDKLLDIARKLKINDKRFEFHLEYKDGKTYPYSKLHYDPKYRVIMFGPIPHKTGENGDYESIIAKLENETGYPKVVRLQSNETLKITKSNFKKALKDLLEQDLI